MFKVLFFLKKNKNHPERISHKIPPKTHLKVWIVKNWAVPDKTVQKQNSLGALTQKRSPSAYPEPIFPTRGNRVSLRLIGIRWKVQRRVHLRAAKRRRKKTPNPEERTARSSGSRQWLARVWLGSDSCGCHRFSRAVTGR